MLKIIYIIIWITAALPFNLDTDTAHIFEGTQTNAKFGYSTTLWQDKENNKWAVIGAPLTKRSLNASNEEDLLPVGSVVLCGMNALCEDITPFPSLTRAIHVEALKVAPKKNFVSVGLGETIFYKKLQNYLMVCAPRYLGLNAKEMELTARGACFAMDNPHDGKPPHEILPFTSNRVKFGTKSYYTPSALSGFGATMSQDQVLLGMPAMFYDQGGIIRYNLKSPKDGTRQSKQGPAHTLDTFYEGWAMTSGKFDGTSEAVAVSVPGKPSLLGSVVFYTPYFRELEVRAGIQIEGKEMGSRFAHTLAAGDFDGDGADDLAVSAYLSNVGSMTDKEYVIKDSGKIFVYYAPLKTDFGLLPEQTLSISKPKAYFGYSLTCPGDLNMDGYSDLVVGAPYDGDGKVYIYSGSKEGLRVSASQIITPVSVALNRRSYPKGLGFSVGGGVDVDSNGYPDVVVGAVTSNSAVLIRSSPVITFKIKASFDDSGIIRLGKNVCTIVLPDATKASLTCFNLTLNMQYVSALLDEKIPVSVLVELDVLQSNPRMLSMNHQRIFPIHEREINNARDDPEPFTLSMYVKPGKQSIVEPIVAKVSLELKTKKMKESNSENKSTRLDSQLRIPILEEFSKKQVETAVRLVCEDEETCFAKPDLSISVESANSFVVGENKPLVFNVSVQSKDEPAYQTRLNVIVPEEFFFPQVISRSSNEIACRQEQNVLGKVISCHIADTLPAGHKLEFSLLFNYSPLQVAIKMQMSALLKYRFNFTVFSDNQDRTAMDNTFIIKLEPILKAHLDFISFSFPDSVVAWTNDSVALEKAWHLFTSTTREKATLAQNETLDQSEDDFGPKFTHKFSILNSGPSPVTDAKLTIRWPFAINKVFPLTLLQNKLLTNGPIECSPIPDKFQFHHYIAETAIPTIQRSKRSNSELHQEDAMTSHDKINLVNSTQKTEKTSIGLDCNIMQCFDIQCNISALSLSEQVSVEINVLAIATILKELKYEHFVFTSSISFESRGGQKLNKTSKISTVITIGKTELSATDFLIDQWWILLVCFVVGVLIILLISGLLYKCGFFKRKRVDRKSLIIKENPESPNVFVSENKMPLKTNQTTDNESEGSSNKDFDI